ncbi:MAG: alpha/beta hydrolase [Ignavibacteria bacterium]
MKHIFLIITVLTTLQINVLKAQTFEYIEYPYPVNEFHFIIESVSGNMAYMDVKPAVSNGRTVLLLHGKNFNGYYWKNVIASLSDSGYRVIAPDQIGWGKSSYPNIHYSFHLLSRCTKQLLDSLGITFMGSKIEIIAHSMGGMLGTRFALMYPESVDKLILENPIGLEDYKTFVPYRTVDEQFQKELSATYESYKKYRQSYYPVWKPEYEELVKVQASVLKYAMFKDIAFVNAVTYEMIYEQPVVYEFKDLKVPVYFIIGKEDRTIVGKDLLSKEMQESHGQVVILARDLVQKIPVASIIEFPGVGHIPHIQEPEMFMNTVFSILEK